MVCKGLLSLDYIAIFIFPDDSISCMPGEYFDPDFYECIPCPMGTYCPEGTTEPLGCPGAQFTWNNGSTDVTDCSDGSKNNMSRDMRFPTIWYVRPAKAKISLRIRAV